MYLGVAVIGPRFWIALKGQQNLDSIFYTIRSNDWISNRKLVSNLIRKITLGTVWNMGLRVGGEKQVRAKKSLQIFLDVPIKPL